MTRSIILLTIYFISFCLILIWNNYKYLCSICNEDTRGCRHINGSLYGGIVCNYRQINPRFDHIALVEEPKDPICRIWPWNIQYNADGEVTGLTNLTLIMPGDISDFLDAI